MSVSTDTTHDGRPVRSGWRRFFTACLKLFLVLAVLFTIWRIWISHQVSKRLAELRQAGYPTTMQELQQKYYAHVSSDQNAATFFTEAFALLNHTNLGKSNYLTKFNGKFPRPSTPFSPEEKAGIASDLSENRQALELLHRNPPAKISHYPLDFARGLSMSQPHLAKLKKSTQLLTLQAVSDADHGQPAAVIEDLGAAFRLSHSVAEEPFLNSQLVHINCRAMIISSLEHILNQIQLTDAQLDHLSSAFHDDENPRAMEMALTGEGCMGADLFEMSAGQRAAAFLVPESNFGNTPILESRVGFSLMSLSGFTARDFNFYLKVMAGRLRISALPFPQRLDSAAAFEDQIYDQTHRGLYFFSGMLLPALSYTTVKEGVNTANLNIIQTVLAIERYRLGHEDALPEKLSDLTPGLLPAVPMDPFDGQPLRYKKLPQGYLIYSIGRDRKDDGGLERKPKQSNPAEDIVFTIER